MKTKPCIVQHIAGFNNIGGTTTDLRLILSSKLANKYQFTIVNQERPASGINIPLILEMAKKIKSNNPKIVHIRGLQNEGFHGVLAAYFAGCRNIIVAAHGFSEDGNVRNFFYKWILSTIIEPITVILAKKVYCVCKEATNHRVIERYAKNKTSVIYNGISVTFPKDRVSSLREEMGINYNSTIALFVGRINKDKGLYTLAEALNHMSDPPLLWIAGDGPETNTIKKAFGGLMDSGKVKFLGRRDDIELLLNACDFFVLPSYHENLSYSILEAMAAERAVLTTSVGGNPEVVINGETGILIPAGDSVALAKNLSYLSENKEIRDEMGRKGRVRVERIFSLDNTISHLEDLYDSMLEG